MYELTCPTCGRHLVLTDAPPGYKILAPCRKCRGQKRVPTGEPARPERGPAGRRPDPLRYR